MERTRTYCTIQYMRYTYGKANDIGSIAFCSNKTIVGSFVYEQCAFYAEQCDGSLSRTKGGAK